MRRLAIELGLLVPAAAVAAQHIVHRDVGDGGALTFEAIFVVGVS